MNSQQRRITDTGVIYEYSPILAEKIYTPEDSLKNGVVTSRYRVQMRQTVKSIYPAARANELFSSDEFGGKGQEFVENRVCFLNVPKGATLEVIQRKIDQMDSPKLVRTLSLRPRLSEDQERTIVNGRNPKSYEDYLEDFIPAKDGSPILYHGMKQYRKTHLSKAWTEDVDFRDEDLREMKGKAVQIAAPSTGDRVPSRL